MAEGGVDFTQQEEDAIKCCICLDIFKNPRFLSCHHSACEICLENYIRKTARNGGIACPICRARVPLPEQGVRGFQKNFYLAPSPCTNVATNVKCREHSKEDLVAFCNPCDKLLCVKCVLTTHKLHQTRHVDEVAEDVKQQLSTAMRSATLRTNELILEENTKKLENEKLKLQDAWTIDLQSVSDQCQTLQNIVEEQERQKHAEVDTYYKRLVKDIESTLEKIHSQLQLGKQLVKKAAMLPTSSSNVAIVQMGRLLMKHIATRQSGKVLVDQTRLKTHPKPIFNPGHIDEVSIAKSIGTVSGDIDHQSDLTSQLDCHQVSYFCIKEYGGCGLVLSIAPLGNNAWISVQCYPPKVFLVNVEGKILRSVPLEMIADVMEVDAAGSCIMSFLEHRDKLAVLKSDGSLSVRSLGDNEVVDMSYRVNGDGQEELLLIDSNAVYRAQHPEYNPVRLPWQYPKGHCMYKITAESNSNFVCVVSGIKDSDFVVFYKKGVLTIMGTLVTHTTHRSVCNVVFDIHGCVLVAYNNNFIDRLDKNGQIIQMIHISPKNVFSLNVSPNNRLWVGRSIGIVEVYEMSQ